MQIVCGIVTVSDRASQGIYEDLGGPALKTAAGGYGLVAGCLHRGFQGCQLVLTTGGTGVARRDVTPESVLEISDREIPGFGEAMRMKSLAITPNAVLSRSLGAVVGQTLVLCLPGKPAGAVECLGFVAGAIPHCVKVLQEVPTSC